MMGSSSLRRSSLLLLLLLAACGGKQPDRAAFASDWQNDNGQSIARVYALVKQSPLPKGASVAVFVARDGLHAKSLTSQNTWSFAHALNSRPFISGDVVVGASDTELFCLTAESGKKLWSVGNPDGLKLRGAGDDGAHTALSLGSDDVTKNALLVIDRSGRRVLSLNPEMPIGVPAVQGGVVFAPWGNQYVSAIDIAEGTEIGRLLTRSQVSQALNIGGQLYFGEQGLLAFDEHLAEAVQTNTRLVSVPRQELPGSPQWLTSGTRIAPLRAQAEDKIRYFARPTSTAAGDSAAKGPGLASNRFAATYFRLVLGFSDKQPGVHWVTTLEHDVLGGTAAPGAFVFCDSGGNVTTVSATNGQQLSSTSLAVTPESCVIQASNLQPTPRVEAKSLVAQISEGLLLDAPQLVSAQGYLLSAVTANPEPEITQVLIELASRPRTAPALLEQARSALARRRTGGEYMLAALRTHYDFLAGILAPPPVGPLADALAAMGEKAAAPLLAEHLNDPANASADVARAARALVILAGPEQYEDLKIFFTLYRAAASDEKLVEAVISTAEALIKIGGPAARRLLLHAANDPLTHADVRKALGSVEEQEEE